jgi:hypothetical protein
LKKSTKKLIITTVVFIVVLAVVITVIVFVKKKPEKDEPTSDGFYVTDENGETVYEKINGGNTGTADEEDNSGNNSGSSDNIKNSGKKSSNNSGGSSSGDNSLDSISDEIKKQSEQTTKLKTNELTTAKNTKINSGEVKQIEAFISGNYYINASIDSEGESTNLKMSKKGENFEMGVNEEGVSLSIMYLNGTFYLKNPSKKQYTALTQDVMDSIGIDTSEFAGELKQIDFSGYKFTSVARSTGTLNNKSCVIYNYTVSTGDHILFYLIDNNIKRIVVKPSDGSDSLIINVNSFSTTIPSDQLTVSGFEETDLFTFASGMGIDSDIN